MIDSASKPARRFGLGWKLVLAILVAGTIPIVVGLSIVYVRGDAQLKEVIGESFEALALEASLKLTGEMQQAITANLHLARRAAADPEVRRALQEMAHIGSNKRFGWPTSQDDESGGVRPILDSWLSGSEGAALEAAPVSGPLDSRLTVRISNIRFDEAKQAHIFRISAPVRHRESRDLIGWLHRDYDVKRFFDHHVYPIRFGNTGHVMLIDNLGTIISCPLLGTGTSIDANGLLGQVAKDEVGWVVTDRDGHGGHRTSLVGYASLAGVNPFLAAGASWHMFVWQDSREILAPSRSLLGGVAFAGLLSVGLLGIMGFYVSRHIVSPIRRLGQESARIAGGDLEHAVAIRTGDEIEDLARELDEMRMKLRQFIHNLEELVEERTQKLEEAQAEKDLMVDQLIQAEKMSAIGTMASGIGHEINNPLYAILGLAEAIGDEKELSHCHKHSREIIKYSKHISEIVKNLSGFIRPAGKHDLQPVDVNEKLLEAVSMARRSLIDDHLEIQEDFAPVPTVLAKGEEVVQVFYNIIRNGIQAMQGRGVMVLRTQQLGDDVSIWVQDTGSGITKEILGKLFDPFFTTKGPDEGEGLGLFFVQQSI